MSNYKLYNDKCENVIPSIENESIDMVVTSPPYNVDLGNNKYNKNPYDLYNDNKEHLEYILWLKNIFKSIYPKLKKGGRIAINIGDGKNGMVPSHSDIIQFMLNDLNYIFMTNIIWNKKQISNRTSWGSFNSPSSPSFPTPFEYIMVFAKETKKLQEKGITDLTKEEFIDWSLALWNFSPETNMQKIGHPAAFPIDLPMRLIKLFSWQKSTILDPFSGSGTTGQVCIETDRNYIGIELSKKYYDISEKRLKNIKNKYDNEIF